MLVAGLGPSADISAAYTAVEQYSLDFGRGGAYALGFVVACAALVRVPAVLAFPCFVSGLLASLPRAHPS